MNAKLRLQQWVKYYKNHLSIRVAVALITNEGWYVINQIIFTHLLRFIFAIIYFRVWIFYYFKTFIQNLDGQ